MTDEQSVVPAGHLSTFLGCFLGINNPSIERSLRAYQEDYAMMPSLLASQSEFRPTLLECLKLAKGHQLMDRKLSREKGKQVQTRPPQLLDSNSVVYQLSSCIVQTVRRLKSSATDPRSGATSKMLAIVVASRGLAHARTPGPEIAGASSSYLHTVQDELREQAALLSLESEIWESCNEALVRLRRARMGLRKNKRLRVKTISAMLLPPGSKKLEKPWGTKVLTLGRMVLLEFSGKVWPLTHEHLARLTKRIRSLSNFLRAGKEMSLTVPSSEMLERVDMMMSTAYREESYNVGGIMKAARTLLICSLDRSAYSGSGARRDMLSTMEGSKRELGDSLSLLYRELTSSDEAAINLANMFRFSLMPDELQCEAIDQFEMAKVENPIKEELLPVLEARSRRAQYLSLWASGHKPTLSATAVLGQRLAQASRASRVSPSALGKYPVEQWSHVVLDECPSVTKMRDVLVRPSSKSSTRDYPSDLSLEDIRQVSASLASGDPKGWDKGSLIGTENDIVGALKGARPEKPESFVAYWEGVFRKHKEFELKILVREGRQPNSQELESFLADHPEASNYITAFPKAGEVHKATTRMFLAGTRRVKRFTQACERVAKQVGAKLPGSSITKSREARMRDLREMASSQPPIGKKQVMISFDMTGFARNMNQRVVRAYLTPLSELTGESVIKDAGYLYRSCVVVRSTHDTFDYSAGIMGAFEGFQNFAWSGLHHTIAEYALSKLGLPGKILVYSDDGIMKFYVDEGLRKEEVWAMAKSIQETYLDFGFAFNLKKTFVSGTVGEYLGDVLYGGRVLVTWMKELCSLSRSVSTSGLCPLYRKIKNMEAQGRACVGAGMSPILASDLVVLYSFFLIRRIVPTLEVSLLPLLAILPPRYGGFRVASPYAMLASTTVDPEADFIADLGSLDKFSPRCSAAFALYARSQGKETTRIMGAILTGLFVDIGTQSTSGQGLMREGLKLVLQSGKVTIRGSRLVSPFSFKEIKSIELVAKSLTNLDPFAMCKILMASESWQKYQDGITLVGSPAALRLVKSKELAQLQAQDTRICSRSVAKWSAVVDKTTLEGPIDSPGVYLEVRSRVVRRVSLAPVKLSPRTVLQPESSPSKMSVSVSYNPVQARDSFSLEHTVQLQRRPASIRPMSWSSEATGDRAKKSVAQMLAMASSVIVHSPQSFAMVRLLCRSLGVELPYVPTEMVTSFDRLKVRHGMDYSSFTPQWFQAYVKKSYSVGLSDALFGTESEGVRLDRTTYLEAAGDLAYLGVLSSLSGSEENPRKGTWSQTASCRVSFAVDPTLLALSIIPHEMRQRRAGVILPPARPVEEDLERDFLDELCRVSDEARAVAMIAEISPNPVDRPGEDLGPEETALTLELALTTTVERWVSSGLRALSLGLSPPPPMVFVPRVPPSVYSDALCRAALEALPPTDKRGMMDIVMRTMREGKLVTDRPRGQFAAVQLHFDKKYEMGRSLLVESMGIPGPEMGVIVPEARSLEFRVSLAHVCSTLRLNSSAPLVIPIRDPKGFSHAGEAYVSTMKLMFTATLSHLMDKLRDSKYDPMALEELFPVWSTYRKTNDELITALVLGRSLLRPSRHRTWEAPFNHVMFAIEVLKMGVHGVRVARGSWEHISALTTMVLAAREEKKNRRAERFRAAFRKRSAASSEEDGFTPSERVLCYRESIQFFTTRLCNLHPEDPLLMSAVNQMNNIGGLHMGPDHLLSVQSQLPRECLYRLAQLLSLAATQSAEHLMLIDMRNTIARRDSEVNVSRLLLSGLGLRNEGMMAAMIAEAGHPQEPTEMMRLATRLLWDSGRELGSSLSKMVVRISNIRTIEVSDRTLASIMDAKSGALGKPALDWALGHRVLSDGIIGTSTLSDENIRDGQVESELMPVIQSVLTDHISEHNQLGILPTSEVSPEMRTMLKYGRLQSKTGRRYKLWFRGAEPDPSVDFWIYVLSEPSVSAAASDLSLTSLGWKSLGLYFRERTTMEIYLVAISPDFIRPSTRDILAEQPRGPAEDPEGGAFEELAAAYRGAAAEEEEAGWGLMDRRNWDEYSSSKTSSAPAAAEEDPYAESDGWDEGTEIRNTGIDLLRQIAAGPEPEGVGRTLQDEHAREALLALAEVDVYAGARWSREKHLQVFNPTELEQALLKTCPILQLTEDDGNMTSVSEVARQASLVSGSSRPREVRPAAQLSLLPSGWGSYTLPLSSPVLYSALALHHQQPTSVSAALAYSAFLAEARGRPEGWKGALKTVIGEIERERAGALTDVALFSSWVSRWEPVFRYEGAGTDALAMVSRLQLEMLRIQFDHQMPTVLSIDGRSSFELVLEECRAQGAALGIGGIAPIIYRSDVVEDALVLRRPPRTTGLEDIEEDFTWRSAP